MSKNFRNQGQGPATIPAAQAQAIAQTLFQQATSFHQKGEFAQAQTIYESLLKVQPRHFEGLQSFGSLAYQTNQYQLAIALISKAIEISPKSAALYSNIGLPFQALQSFEEALANHDKAIALEPNFAEAHNNRANTLKELNRPDEALIGYDKAIALKPGFAQAHNGRGMVLTELNRFEEAVASFDNVIALNPDYAEAYNGRGMALAQLEQLNEALASCEKAITLTPDYAEAYYNRGHLLQRLERIDEALANYDKAIALKPYYPDAYYRRGKTLQHLGRLKDALQSYEKAIALAPKHNEAICARDVLLTQLAQPNAIAASSELPFTAPSTQSLYRARKIPIPATLTRYYANYQYANSRFGGVDIITIDGHDIRVRDRVEQPEIVVFDNVLTDLECELLIELSRPKLQRSVIFDSDNANAKGKVSAERTSEGMAFQPGENPFIQTIETRFAKLMNSPIEHGEELSILHYKVGEEYKPHFDFIRPDDKNCAIYLRKGGQRIATLVLYLNDVEAGGETIFPHIDLSVTPRKGSGVYFSYYDATGKLDPLTFHGGAPVTRGEKWIATKWIRQNAWQIKP